MTVEAGSCHANARDVQAALAFIELLTSDEGLREQVRAILWKTDLGALCALARTRGYSFCEPALRQAFATDWHMRRLRSHGSRHR